MFGFRCLLSDFFWGTHAVINIGNRMKSQIKLVTCLREISLTVLFEFFTNMCLNDPFGYRILIQNKNNNYKMKASTEKVLFNRIT